MQWLPADPRPALLASPEPAARFVTLTAVLGHPEGDPEVTEARRAVVADAQVRALAFWPAGWKGRAATPEDRHGVAELTRAVAGLFGPDGMVTPHSCYKGFEGFSFGQKKRPSPWATARLCGILLCFSGI